jgi:ferric-dicitrate binding protein FerR (iron transport regulator)
MKAELQHKIQGYLDGTSTPDELAALEARLQSDAAARRELLLAAGLETQLAVLLRAERQPAPAAVEPARRWKRRMPWVAIPLAAAAALVAACGVGRWAMERRSEGTVTLVQGDATVTARGRTAPVRLAAGSRIVAGDTLAVGSAGYVEFRYRDGSHLHLYKETRALLTAEGGAKRLVLQHGAVDATITPQATNQPMVATTAHIVGSVRGTEFRLLAADQSSWLGVRQGVVEVQRRADQKVVRVPAGRYTVVMRGGIPFACLDARCPYWRGQCLAMTGDNRYP